MKEILGCPSRLTEPEIVRWLRAAAPNAQRIPAPVPNEERSYTRTLLHRDERYEIVVLHWMPNAATPVHDHGGSLCWLALASGTMTVENFLRHDSAPGPGSAHITLSGRETLATGAIDYRQDDLHLHRCATGEQAAITLHVYARPLVRFFTFDEHAQTCAAAASNYDAVLTT